MKIAEFGSLQMVRTNQEHFGYGKVSSVTNIGSKIQGISSIQFDKAQINKTEDTTSVNHKSFQDYLLEAVNTVNNQQMEVSNLQQKIITNPDEVDIHDVTIAMSKARMSLNLAQNVIDRLVTDWNEITTTR